ncbi:glycosyltransferase [Mesorhizobium sp. B1-1-5]|uniref:glycosyltransferase n=1 Tax=Mesorhizobium sp. B1-1-5 TaxID=2589979 RepID=UPI001127D893|nr:glycosyltransferase [Mesorhizobium sp. B1-1-5]TPO12346.1 glycosyltransferase [Mesorhizobium sp. B1-1-5]
MPNVANILVVIEAEIATTHLIEQIMRACHEHGVRHKTQFLDRLQASEITPDVIPMFVRCADPLALWWAQILVDAKRPYAYYIDDNFWRIAGNTSLAAYYRHPVVRKSLEFAVSNAQAVIANSIELAKFVSSFNDRVTVLPTFFDFAAIDGVQPSPTDEIRIGFAGSPSRIDDLDLISGVIKPTLERFPKAVFEFAGVLPRDVTIGERIRFFPHTGDYDAYIKFQVARNWAVGLAPLVDHEANRGKTDNKYREYGACHIAGIYSNITPYSDVVKHSATGLLVDNTQASWLQALFILLEHTNRRETLAKCAFEDVKARYDVLHVSHTWASFFKQLAGHRANHPKPLDQGGFNTKRFWRWLDRLKLHLSITYEEGGLPLITRRIIKRFKILG